MSDSHFHMISQALFTETTLKSTLNQKKVLVTEKRQQQNQINQLEQNVKEKEENILQQLKHFTDKCNTLQKNNQQQVERTSTVQKLYQEKEQQQEQKFTIAINKAKEKIIHDSNQKWDDLQKQATIWEGK